MVVLHKTEIWFIIGCGRSLPKKCICPFNAVWLVKRTRYKMAALQFPFIQFINLSSNFIFQINAQGHVILNCPITCVVASYLGLFVPSICVVPQLEWRGVTRVNSAPLPLTLVDVVTYPTWKETHVKVWTVIRSLCEIMFSFYDWFASW